MVRGIENTTRAIFPTDNYWQIPSVKGTDIDIKKWQEETGGVTIGFNYCKTYKAKEIDTAEVGVHFFLDDYQFERVWLRPAEYISMLAEYKFVCSPDFSLFLDHPRAVQMFSHYKKMWVQAYWEYHGINVIPTICWSDSKSFEWCFDGVPKHGTVAISTKGVMSNVGTKERFYAGYYQMLKRVEPSQIMLFGKNIGGLDGNVIDMGYEFSERLKGVKNGR